MRKGVKNNSAVSRTALRRQREKEQRYQSILSAAEKLFAAEGYHKASMEQIGAEAELSVGAVYFYFKNKEDLLIRLLDEIGYQLRDMLGQEFRKADGSMEGIARAGQVFFEEFCPRHPQRIAIFFRESVGQSQHVERHRKRIFDRLIEDVVTALKRLQETCGIQYASRFSVEVMAVGILGMYERVAYQYLIWKKENPKNLALIGRDAVDFILGGIKNLGASPQLE